MQLTGLRHDAAVSCVLVLQGDGTQEQRYVETGIYSDEYVECLSGLSEGEIVVNTYTAKIVTNSIQARGPPPF